MELPCDWGPRWKLSSSTWSNSLITGNYRTASARRHVLIFPPYLLPTQLPNYLPTVYPKKYAHGFCFAVVCCGYTLTDFPISIRLTSLALWQSNDCPSASKATNMDKYFMWIHYERLHNHNKAKHNKTVCIFLGIYCTYLATYLPTHTHIYTHTRTHAQTCIHACLLIVMLWHRHAIFQIGRRQALFLSWMQDSNPRYLDLQQAECSLTSRLSFRGSSY